MNNINILIIICCLYSLNIFAQNAIICADKMNVLYAGINNPVTIVSELEFDSISLNTGTIKAGALNKYNVYFKSEGTATFTLFKNKKALQSKVFRVKSLPKPEIKIANKFSPKELTKKELGLVDSLKVEIENFDLPAEFTLTEMSIYGKRNGKSIIAEVSGSVLSDSAKELLQNCDSSSKVFIDARCKFPDGKVSGISLVIIVK